MCRGNWAFENNRTLVFKPEKGFERNTSYQVNADLSEWFEAEGKDKWFAFGFTTLPLVGIDDRMDDQQETKNGYDLTAVLFTPDKESPETVESLVDSRRR